MLQLDLQARPPGAGVVAGEPLREVGGEEEEEQGEEEDVDGGGGGGLFWC